MRKTSCKIPLCVTPCHRYSNKEDNSQKKETIPQKRRQLHLDMPSIPRYKHMYLYVYVLLKRVERMSL